MPDEFPRTLSIPFWGLLKPNSVLPVCGSPCWPFCARAGSPELHPGTRPWLYLRFPGTHLGHKSHQSEAFNDLLPILGELRVQVAILSS